MQVGGAVDAIAGYAAQAANRNNRGPLPVVK